MLVIYACAVSGLKTGKDFSGYVGQFPAFETCEQFPAPLNTGSEFPAFGAYLSCVWHRQVVINIYWFQHLLQLHQHLL